MGEKGSWIRKRNRQAWSDGYDLLYARKRKNGQDEPVKAAVALPKPTPCGQFRQKEKVLI